MARGAYRETTAVRALRQLVAFAEGEHEDAVTLAEAARELAALQMSNAQTTKALRALTAGELRQLKQELRSFLRYAAGRTSDDPKAILIRVELMPLLGAFKQTKGRKRWLFAVAGTPRDVLLFQVATLLATVSEDDRLRFCRAPDCGRVFVKVGRREYCSDRCQRRMFISRYDPFKAQPRRKDRYGNKKTR